MYYTTSKDLPSLELDNNGVPTDDAWVAGDQTQFEAVNNPYVTHYKVISNDAPNSDLGHVAAQTVTATDGSQTYTVVYAPAYASTTTMAINQTINSVDQQGKTVAPSHEAPAVTFLTATNPVAAAHPAMYYTTSTDFPTLELDNYGGPTDDAWVA